MSGIDWNKQETVGVVTMNGGENRHNPEFIRVFLENLAAIERDSDIASVIILSSDRKNWSLGIDLGWMTGALTGNDVQGVREFLHGLNQLFTRILLYPMPVIAAINGHTFGGGTILACACDFRFMKSDRGFFCFPEIDIGLPFLPGMLGIIQKAIPYYKLEELVLTGKRAVAGELEAAHVIVRACENEEALIRDAMAFAKGFAKKRSAFGEMKKNLHRKLVDIMQKEDPAFIDSLRLMT